MLISALENSEVCSVIFIRDYLQFYFEGEENNATLTIYTWPFLIVNGENIESGKLGYRDSLCSFIDLKVKAVEIKKGYSLKVTFDNGDCMVVSLKEAILNGQEAAMLRIENQITIW